MSEPSTTESTQLPLDGNLYADERYMVRNRRQIRMLMQALVDQRATLSAHPDGREQSFPSAVLDVDDDSMLLDGSPMPAINRSAAEADFLLCFAQVDKVMVRFRTEAPRQVQQDGHAAFRVALPEELYHLQRRELYRLETPVGDSPWCTLPGKAVDGDETQRWRAVDISAGGIALLLPSGQQALKLQQRHAGCLLELPDTPPITVTLVVCSVVARKQANGLEQERIGLRFEELPRGADAAIQRYIFRVDRERKARLNGEG